MYRFYYDITQRKDNVIEIASEDVNHIKNVLRMKTGERLILCDGNGNDAICELMEPKERSLSAQIIAEEPARSELPVRLVLLQGLPKKDKMELIIQKAVELGVSEIIPVITARTIVRPDEGKEEKKVQRWQAIAESAAKQSGRGLIPQIHSIVSMKQALVFLQDFDYNILLYENAKGMSETAKALRRATEGNSVSVFVGPEGGFTTQEVEASVAAGSSVLSLGNRILRTETAGLAMLSMLMLTIECAADR